MRTAPLARAHASRPTCRGVPSPAMGRSAYLRPAAGPSLASVGGPTDDGDSPRLARIEQRVGIDLVRPAQEVLLRVLLCGSVDGTPIRRVRAGLDRLAALERVASCFGFLRDG